MGYEPLTSTDDVFAYFKTTFTEDSSPAISQIEQWIDEGTAIIYSALANSYTVPVTDEDALLILRVLCNKYVRLHIQFTRRGTNNTIKGRLTVPKEIDMSSFERSLALYATGQQYLPGTAPRAHRSESYTVNNNIEFVANKDEQQW